MRVTEFIDFINREDIPDIEEYSHLEIREEKIDSEGNIKFVLDALNGVFYKDDSQVVHIESIKEYSTEPKTIVRIYSYES